MTIVTRLSAQEAAELLHEPEVGLLQRAWRVLGADRAEALVNEVLQIEANGGMPRHNGKGRRTPGGVFFELVKQRSSGRQRYAIFQYATAPQPTPPVHPCRWSDVTQALVFLHSQPKGEATVKLTLVGRPAATQIKGRAVIFEMNGTPPPTLPRGLPPLPAKMPITWTVVVALRQWNKVKASLEENPKDKLVIEGYPFTENGTHFLMAMSCRSIAQQQAQKAEP